MQHSSVTYVTSLVSEHNTSVPEGIPAKCTLKLRTPVYNPVLLIKIILLKKTDKR